MLFKLDGKLFRRYTRNADVRRVSECQFADDAALLAKTRTGAEQTLLDCSANNTTFGLRLSTSKTKFMAAGREVKDEDRTPIEIENSEIECVKEFPYLGSIIAANGRMDADVCV